MKYIGFMVGRIVYWVGWPLLCLGLRNTERTRVVIECNGEVLLLRDWVGKGCWSLPGGGVKQGEKLPKAAVREVYEEVGIRMDVKKLRYLGERRVTLSGITVYQHMFFVQLSRRPKKMHLQRIEIGAAQWVSFAAARKLKLDESAVATLDAWRHHSLSVKML
jgi:8-oxo-dGTP pyrophosphatase MutT (NUDIX family)